MLKSLLYQLEHVDLIQSSAIVQLLLPLLPHIRVYGLARRAETLVCRRVEYVQSQEVCYFT